MAEAELSDVESLKAEVAHLRAALMTIGTQTNSPPPTAEAAFRLLGSIGVDVRRALGIKKSALIPQGWNEPLPTVPGEVTITENDIHEALAAWDAAVPGGEGMLDAQVTTR